MLSLGIFLWIVVGLAVAFGGLAHNERRTRRVAAGSGQDDGRREGAAAPLQDAPGSA